MTLDLYHVCVSVLLQDRPKLSPCGQGDLDTPGRYRFNTPALFICDEISELQFA